MLDYFIPCGFACYVRHNLIACRIGLQSAAEYINELRKHLINYTDVLESEANFVFEMNLADWLSTLVLPNNCADFDAVMCSEHIGSI